MLMFYIIELYYIVCFSMTNKSMRTFYVNKNSVCLYFWTVNIMLSVFICRVQEQNG